MEPASLPAVRRCDGRVVRRLTFAQDEALQIGGELAEHVRARLADDGHRREPRRVAARAVPVRVPARVRSARRPRRRQPAARWARPGHGCRASRTSAPARVRCAAVDSCSRSATGRRADRDRAPPRWRGARRPATARDRRAPHALAVARCTGAPHARRRIAMIERGAESQARRQRRREDRVVEKQPDTRRTIRNLLSCHGPAVRIRQRRVRHLRHSRRGRDRKDEDEAGETWASHGCSSRKPRTGDGNARRSAVTGTGQTGLVELPGWQLRLRVRTARHFAARSAVEVGRSRRTRRGVKRRCRRDACTATDLTTDANGCRTVSRASPTLRRPTRCPPRQSVRGWPSRS